MYVLTSVFDGLDIARGAKREITQNDLDGNANVPFRSGSFGVFSFSLFNRRGEAQQSGNNDRYLNFTIQTAGSMTPRAY